MKAEAMPVIEDRLFPGRKAGAALGITELAAGKAAVPQKELGAAPLADGNLATCYLVALLARHTVLHVIVTTCSPKHQRYLEKLLCLAKIPGEENFLASKT